MDYVNKYRPKTFEDVLGHNDIVEYLKKVQDNPRGCYIFVGESGSGKTTLARIFASKTTCIEFNGSDVGIDVVNRIIEDVKYMTTHCTYIIDEVHLISYSAMQGLLKILEETPKNITFILCTTEKHKIPLTVQSRGMIINFRHLSTELIVKQLEIVCKAEGITYDSIALKGIAVNACGNTRTALNLLEQFGTEVTIDKMRKICGGVDYNLLLTVYNQLVNKDKKGIILTINKGEIDYKALATNLFTFILNLSILELTNDIKQTTLPQEIEPYLNDIDKKYALDNISAIMNLQTKVNQSNIPKQQLIGGLLCLQ